MIELMKFRLKTILVFTLLLSCFFAFYALVTRPVVLRPGMERPKVIKALRAVGAYDLVASKWDDNEPYVLIPGKDAEILNGVPTTLVIPNKMEPLDNYYAIPAPASEGDEKGAIEALREKSAVIAEEEIDKFWMVPYFGRIEFHFTRGKLVKIVQWDGSDNIILNEVLLKKMSGEPLLYSDMRKSKESNE